MKLRTLAIIVPLLAAASVACTDIIEPFYTRSYEIERVEASAALSDDEAELKAEIEAAVMEAAPVRAGGGYLIEYIEAFGGRLTVYPAENTQSMRGTFTELTAEEGLVFDYAGSADTCRLSTYNNEGEAQKVLLEFDYTDMYRALYPDAGITSVVRNEYTMTWAN